MDAYLQEECSFNAILGPFESKPIPGAHTSPFMMRHKPNSECRRVIIDLSWPLGASVNTGIDKQTYLGSEFELTFPSVDDITNELKHLGHGAHFYKVDVSHAWHVKVDPGDYDLLGLQWHGAYVDTCLPFGTRHGSQIFQCLSDTVCFMMRQKGFCVIDYIDDYVGVGIPGIAHESYNHLVDLMHSLGLTISEKKLVPPSTQVVCLGVLIDTECGTISISDDKLTQICDTIKQWQRKCTKRQLQIILGLLLYVHKCVKPARVFLNRMLDLLRASHNNNQISLTDDFKRDLAWFEKFLSTYNGVNLYDHKPIHETLELDACLTSLGGRVQNCVYHLPLEKGYQGFTIVHLEMVNILVAIRLFASRWSGRKILVRCDNQAVFAVLKPGRTRDPYLSACARNIWYCAATHDIDDRYVHIQGKENRIADLLSRWQGSVQNTIELCSYIPQPCWLNVSQELLFLDPEL